MVSFTKQLTPKQFDFIKSKLSKYQIPKTTEHMIFAAQYLQTKIFIYKTMKILVQGKNVEKVLQYLTIKKPIEIDDQYGEISYIGCDEVGTGDYFGGIVCIACFVPKKDEQTLKRLGVVDSKKLSNEEILKITRKVTELQGEKKIGIEVGYKSVEPKEYNILYDKCKNANVIKAICHNNALSDACKLLKKNKSYKLGKNVKTVMDQFVNKNKYYEYLNKNCKPNSISEVNIFETKAESKYISVALASIIARAFFINQMNKISQDLGIQVPFGSTDPKIKKIASCIGRAYLNRYVKLHFRTTKELN
ncbi:MAG: ribonuclease HIII [Mycoplasmoidaceae bacterium]|nr:ribonuclease HIII [Mycoplasmoidaceae bacterium]